MSAVNTMLQHRYGGLFRKKRRFRGPLDVNPLVNILVPLLKGDKEEALKGAKYHRKGAKRAQMFFMPETAKKAGAAMEPVFEKIEQALEGDWKGMEGMEDMKGMEEMEDMKGMEGMEGIEGMKWMEGMDEAIFAGVAEAFGEFSGHAVSGSVSVTAHRSGADAFIDVALDAIEDGRPKLAFQHLFNAEIVHHAKNNQPPAHGEDERLRGAWQSFGEMLPDKLW